MAYHTYHLITSMVFHLYYRARDQMEHARRTYETLNTELHAELPALFDSRALFLITSMQTTFAAEEVFHAETAKVGKRLCMPIRTFIERMRIPRHIRPHN